MNDAQQGADQGREAAIRAALAPVAGDRVEGVRLTENAVTLVVEVGGLDDGARASLEDRMRAALAGMDLPPLRIAMTAERGPEKPKPRLIAVGSGKGGVGKSTVSANLAVAMKRAGRRVGLVDADIYGPSQPRLMHSEDKKPQAKDKQLIPVTGVLDIPMLSMGHLATPDQAIAWRGPMAGNALAQLIEADWGDVTDLVIDLPPGTGDVQLTMIQKFKPIGAVIVSTPQDLALMDARRAIAFFDKAAVPTIGIVENMAGFACPHCGEVSDPFGAGGAEAAARELGRRFLGRIPLTMTLREESDAGTPPAAGSGEISDLFADLAGQVMAFADSVDADADTAKA
ncbi:Mrp/NBP35 family ATP-binding protein [Croceicoccus sp. YJ47]|uniref:Mrp/NBP35 family ATP-binding protein n=1 Tax=Croceicoccus sp. YJ47 TaxID=2798724 RepID=UPI00192370B6|nr:Mrp/NBP35 family ATP-binding protein [Croceicoccus sp. YJ47]QQN72941.1 Mrp/NBP35 family ATP-binding protein [Croceicoccus sp. YJ47]